MDGFGRTTKETDPNGSVTYTVYDDIHHAVFTFPGATESLSGGNGTLVTTGPITMTRTQIPDSGGLYDETMTFSGTVTITGNQIVIPTWDSRGTTSDHALFNLIGNATSGSQYTIQSLSRTLSNDAQQTVESDQYLNISNTTYLGTPATSAYSGLASPFDGSATANYYATTYNYNMMGKLAETTTPTGTINFTTYDAIGRQLATYVGTDDIPSSNLNGLGGINFEDFIYAVSSDPTAIPAGTNMDLISVNVYDGGGVGDSNVTQTTTYPGNSMPNRVTQYAYDWRDRMVATKNAVQSSESTSDNTHFISFNVLDNLGEATSTAAYDGDNVSLSLTAPSSSLLRALTVTSYDELGRAFKTTTYDVSPADGSYSTNSAYTTVSESWFDNRGDTVATFTSGQPMTKMVYDGAGRVTATYITDGGGVNNTTSAGTMLSTLSAAESVSNDIVLSQTEYAYDADGNIIMTTTRDRFNTDSNSSKGGLGTNSSGVEARVSFTTVYYDAANRLIESVNVGTYGGSSYTRGGAPTASSDTVLVTFTSYNAAGEVAIVTDPNNIKTETFYDNLGRTTKTIANYVDGTPSNSDDQTTEYTYDGGNHILTMKADMPSGQTSQTTQYIYNVADAIGASLVSSPVVYSDDLLWAVEYPNTSTGAASTSASGQNRFTYDALR